MYSDNYKLVDYMSYLISNIKFESDREYICNEIIEHMENSNNSATEFKLYTDNENDVSLRVTVIPINSITLDDDTKDTLVQMHNFLVKESTEKELKNACSFLLMKTDTDNYLGILTMHEMLFVYIKKDVAERLVDLLIDSNIKLGVVKKQFFFKSSNV